MSTPIPTLKQMVTLLDAKFFEYVNDSVTLTITEVGLLCRFVARDAQGELTKKLEEMGRIEALNRLNDAMGDHRVCLTTEHEEMGIAWLWTNRQRMKLGAYEKRVLRSCTGIRLVGVALAHRDSRAQSAPIYSVHGDGYFSYEAWAWQSGIPPRVIGGGGGVGYE